MCHRTKQNTPLATKFSLEHLENVSLQTCIYLIVLDWGRVSTVSASGAGAMAHACTSQLSLQAGVATVTDAYSDSPSEPWVAVGVGHRRI